MVDKNVLRFEVSVGDEVVMSVGHSTDNLLKEEPGVVFVDVIVLNVVVEFTALGEFHDDKDIVGCV